MWVVCRPVWVNEACQLLLVPSRSSNTPLYPSKCCELMSVPQLLLFLLFFTWAPIWVLWGVESASQTQTFQHARLHKNTSISWLIYKKTNKPNIHNSTQHYKHTKTQHSRYILPNITNPQTFHDYQHGQFYSKTKRPNS